MSKRFGRNQRRKVDQLQTRCDAYQKLHVEQAQEITRLRFQLDDSENYAFQRYAEKHGLLRVFIDRIGTELGKALGEHMRPHAEAVLAAQNKKPTLLMRVDHFAPATETVTVLTGSIPQLMYKVAVR